MRVLITGATGLIGKEIVKQCHNKGIAVNYLTTSKLKIVNSENYQGYYWNPDKEIINDECIKNVQVIIHLVGATIAKRWTEKHKKSILTSRIKTTALLYKTLKNNSNTIKQIVSASAIGYYPDSLTNYYFEDEKAINTSFLGEVVQAWENAVNGFENLNIIVSKIRIGIVFAKNGGAFPQLAKPIKFGVGANMGHGKQWMSWIHLQDLAAIFIYVLNHKKGGVYNAVSPNPATNKTIIQAIAKQTNKPLILPNIPKILMKLVLGEMHILLFESQRVSSKKIENAGFQFHYKTLNQALQSLL